MTKLWDKIKHKVMQNSQFSILNSQLTKPFSINKPCFTKNFMLKYNFL